MDLANITRLPKKTKLPEKFKLSDKRGSEFTGKSRADSCPQASPHPQPAHAGHGMERFCWPAGLSAWPCSLQAPPPLLISWMGTTRSPWFHSNNWQRQCYQRSSHPKSKTLRLLGGKITLSQPKPGHHILSHSQFNFSRNQTSSHNNVSIFCPQVDNEARNSPTLAH